MTRRAWIYVLTIIGLGLGIYLASGLEFSMQGLPDFQTWLVFILMTGLMTGAQMFKTEAPTHQIYHPNLMFAFAGVLILPPFLFANMVLISHLGEWAKERILKSSHLKVWYIQPFNIGMHLLIGFTCQRLFASSLAGMLPTAQTAFIGSALGAAAIYMFFNHLLVGSALVLARGVSWKDSGILERESLLIDFAMLVMGITVAVMVDQNIWWVIPALAPLYLIYRALAIPNLKKQASTDPKTGLWNSEYFRKTLQVEMNRSIRFNRPLVLVLADLDLLRNINNVYGHLAGDAVLIGVAEILKANFREYDTVSRFGGEEYAILMPETNIDQGFERVERIRKEIEKTDFYSPITNRKINVTMSFGITEILDGDKSTADIIHRADLAVYTAKKRGRNCTCYSGQPLGKGFSFLEGVLAGNVDQVGMLFSQDD